MARRKKGSDPSYRLHKTSGQAMIALPRGDGTYKVYYLGAFNSPESRQQYHKILAEWHARAGVPEVYPDITISEMISAFLIHADKHYRHRDGTPTKEVANFKSAFAPLELLYSDHEARDFDVISLRAVQGQMVKNGLSRKVINSKINRIRHVFKWAASLNMVSASVWAALKTVPGLLPGRTAAIEHPKVKPVPDAIVDQTLAFLLPETRAMVEVMRLTGMRPGEATRICRGDLEMDGKVWLYKPQRHKNAWRDIDRVIAIGPKAQAILMQFMKVDPDAPLFSPRDAVRNLWDRRRATRKSEVTRTKVKDWGACLRRFNTRYSVGQLDSAIAGACLKAKVPHWSANQLRHLHGTKTRKQFGLEATAATLGHAHLQTSEIYAEQDLEKAIQIAAAVG